MPIVAKRSNIATSLGCGGWHSVRSRLTYPMKRSSRDASSFQIGQSNGSLGTGGVPWCADRVAS